MLKAPLLFLGPTFYLFIYLFGREQKKECFNRWKKKVIECKDQWKLYEILVLHNMWLSTSKKVLLTKKGETRARSSRVANRILQDQSYTVGI